VKTGVQWTSKETTCPRQLPSALDGWEKSKYQKTRHSGRNGVVGRDPCSERRFGRWDSG
jgi:hypothetical protein